MPRLGFRLVGMVHLGPLPGAPGAGSLDAVISEATADAEALAAAGFDAVMVENFGDAPFYADDVPKITIAAMTRAVRAVVESVDLPVGVNVLRNDALGALAVAAVTGATFIRVNVLTGAMFTDQGLIQGRAAEVGRLRSSLAPDVAILADVFVKHATPPAGSTIEAAAADTFGRGGADGLVVSGRSTGAPADPELLASARRAAPEAPMFVGSGVTAESIGRLLAVADGVIVGTAAKVGAITTNPVDTERARAIVAAARPPSG